MTSMNISLPEDLKEYVEARTRLGYSTPSEFVRELFRHDRKAGAREKLDTMLLEGLNSGDPIPADAEFWADLKREALNRLESRKTALKKTGPEIEMTRAVTQQPRARLDLWGQFVYFGRQAGVEWAQKYLAAVNEPCMQLASQPGLGKPYNTGTARLNGSRRFRIKGFESYLFFCLAPETGIDVVRVIHGARDLVDIFADADA